MILAPRTLQQKPKISAMAVSTKCGNNCDHCGARNGDGSFRYEQMHMKSDVLKAAIEFGRFKGSLQLIGGDPLLWREGDKRLGDLALELREAGVKRFSITVFPFTEKDAEQIEGMRSLAKVAYRVDLWISFNAFGRTKDGGIWMGDMPARTLFTMGVAREAGIMSISPSIRCLPSSEEMTLAYLPHFGNAMPFGVDLVTGIGKGVNLMKGEMRGRWGKTLYKCEWDGKTLAVMPDGAIVPGCGSVGCIGVAPFATIFDSVEAIGDGTRMEHNFSRRLKGTVDFYPCEVHARRMPME